MFFNPLQNPFNSLARGYRLETDVKEKSEIRIPVSVNESIHLICEEDRFFTSQYHALQVDILPTDTSPACRSLESRFLSSKTQCVLPLVPPEEMDHLFLTLDLSDSVSQPDPVRACASPFSGLDNHPARNSKVVDSMIPRIYLENQVLLPVPSQ